MINRNNISWVLVIIFALTTTFFQVSAMNDYHSYTDKHEADLAGQWRAFNKQQEIVDRAKEAQADIARSIKSVTLDLANSKALDELNSDNPDQTIIEEMAYKASKLELELKIKDAESEEEGLATEQASQ